MYHDLQNSSYLGLRPRFIPGPFCFLEVGNKQTVSALKISKFMFREIARWLQLGARFFSKFYVGLTLNMGINYAK